MSVGIWYRYEGSYAEKVDSARNQKEAEYLLHEYRMAFALLPGQHRHGKDKLWVGRKIDEPAN